MDVLCPRQKAAALELLPSKAGILDFSFHALPVFLILEVNFFT